MEVSRTVLTLLFLTAIASGCMHQNGDGGTITEGPESVKIQQVNVQPTQIFSGQSVRVSMTVANAGNLPATVEVGERDESGNINGTSILTDYCPDQFDNTDFSASSTTESDTKESYRLEPARMLTLRWTLTQEGRVPLYGQECNLDFSVPFNYSVEAYRQIQVKKDREVSGSPNLQSESSQGPLVMALETLPGNTGQPNTYVQSQDDEVALLIQLINPEPDEEFRKGLVNVNRNSFYINSSGNEDIQINEEFEDGEWIVNGEYDTERCEMPDTNFRMLQGRSVNIRCEIPLDFELEDPSVLSEIQAGINYTYVKDVQQRTVRVEPRG